MNGDEEWDFDDPRWITAAATVPAPSSTLSYHESRKRQIAKGEERGRLNKKSKQQDEADRLEEGLRTNLIAEDTLAGGKSKALKMMKGMGFVPGEALGAKRATFDPDATSVGGGIGHGGGIGSSTRGGIGSSTASSAAASPAPEQPEKPRTEPIKFVMRDRRTGLGVPTSKPKRVFTKAELEAAHASSTLPDVNLYLDRNKDLFSDRKAHGILRSVRKTLEELDRRAGIEDSVMWKAPEDKEREEGRKRARRAYLGGDVDPDLEYGVDVDGERKDEDERKRGRTLGYDQGLSGTVVDIDEGNAEEEEARLNREEEEEWLSFEARIRLALTLQYLRETYHYCVWCGCQYEDSQDLKSHCPGEDEQDHD